MTDVIIERIPFLWSTVGETAFFVFCFCLFLFCFLFICLLFFGSDMDGGYEVSVFPQKNEAAWKHSTPHSGCRKEGDR